MTSAVSTNKRDASWIMKFITIEMIVAAIIFSFGLGGIWISVVSKVEATEDSLKLVNATLTAHNTKFANAKEASNKLASDVAIVKNDVQHITKAIAEQKTDIKEQNRMLTELLSR